MEARMAAQSSDDRLCSYKLKHYSEVLKKQNDQRRHRMLAKLEASQTKLATVESRAGGPVSAVV
jgi:hypothetical protein